MIGAEPLVGYVVRSAYLWTDDPHEDSDRGANERPAVLILAVRKAERRLLVRVAPVTHSPPQEAGLAVEIPDETKRRLGLDDRRSWIVLDHANEFVWPGPDLRPVPGRKPATIYYGPLPPKLFQLVRERLLDALREHGIPGSFRSQ